MSDSEKPTGSNPADMNPTDASPSHGSPLGTGTADSGTSETVSQKTVQSTEAASEAPPSAGEASTRKRLIWPRMTVIILFALVYAYDLFEAISETFQVTAQIAGHNELATRMGINTVAVPWSVLVANMLLPIVVFFFAMFVSRKRNFGILALVLLAGLSVVAALSLSFDVLAGVLAP